MSHILENEKIIELVHFPYSSCFVPPTETARRRSHAPPRNGAPGLFAGVEDVGVSESLCDRVTAWGCVLGFFLFLFFRLY